MSVTSGPKIPNDSLILSLDAANSKSTKGRRSIITWDSWTVGSGSASGYGQNGDGNTRLVDTNPFGTNEIVWQSLNNDVTSDADGGWNTSSFPIDNTKIYRFTTWVKRKVLGNGSFYLGTYGYNSANSNEGVLNRSNGAVNTNPYFTSFSWNLNVNEWYLVVGHVWPAGSGTGAVHPDTGIYTTAGVKVSTPQDFVWQSTNVNSVHRSYLYYSTDPATNQQWYQPRVDTCDGTEPSISELLGDAGNTWYDVSGNGNHFKLYNLPGYSNNRYVFNGTSQWAQSKNNLNLTGYNSITVEIALKATATTGSYMAWEHTANWNTNSGGLGLSIHSNGTANLLDLHHTNHNTEVARNYALTVGTNMAVHTNVFSRIVDATGRLTYGNGALLSFSTINGYPTGTATVAGSFANSLLYLASRGGTGSYLPAEVASFKIYNKKLSSSEVAQSFNALRGRFGI